MPGYTPPKTTMKEYWLGTPESRKRYRQTSASMMGLLRGRRPVNPKTWAQGLHDLGMILWSAESRRARVIQSRYPQSPTLAKLVKALTAKANRFDILHDTFLEAWTAQAEKIVERSGFDRLDDKQMKDLEMFLLGAEDKVSADFKKNKKFIEGAGGLREILNTIRAQLVEDYGVDIGYLSDETVNYFPRLEDVAWISANVEKAVEQYQQAYILKYEEAIEKGELDPPENFDLEGAALQEARSLVENILIGNAGDLGFIGAPSGFTKSRSLPGSADFVLRDVRVRNPLDAIDIYIRSAAKRGPWVKLFEPKEGALHNDMKAMLREGVAPEDIEAIKHIIYDVAGRSKSRGIFGRVAAAIDFLKMLLNFSMLGRAQVMALGEPAVAGLRTDDVRDSFRSFYNNLRLLVDRADSRDLDDLMQSLGIVSNPAHTLSSLEREGGTFSDSPRIQQISNYFYLGNLLSQVTHHTRKAAILNGTAYFYRLAVDITNPKKKDLHRKWALEELRRSGAPAGHEKDFAQWLVDRDGALPEIDDAMKPLDSYERLYSRMLADFSRDVVQEPRKIDRSWAANAPAGQLAYSYVSFSWRIYEQIYKRIYREAVKRYKEGGAVEGTRYIALNALPAYGVYYASMLAVYTLKTLLLNRTALEDKDEEEQLEYLMKGAGLYTLPFGPIGDAVYNTWGNVIHRKSVASSNTGKMSYFYDALDSIARWGFHDGAKTDKSERAAVEALYRLTAVPALSYLTAVAPVPAGPRTIMGLANSWAGSRDAQEALSDSIFGDDAKTKKGPKKRGER